MRVGPNIPGENVFYCNSQAVVTDLRLMTPNHSFLIKEIEKVRITKSRQHVVVPILLVLLGAALIAWGARLLPDEVENQVGTWMFMGGWPVILLGGWLFWTTKPSYTVFLKIADAAAEVEVLHYALGEDAVDTRDAINKVKHLDTAPETLQSSTGWTRHPSGREARGIEAKPE
jgi:hypothetical protein